jgi:metal-responsive CopG/Arc/MetJ family transcriptional regulator
MDTTSLRLPRHLSAALDRLAVERGTTRSVIIREAVEEYVAASRTTGSGDRVALVERLVTYPGSGRKDGGARSEEYLRRSFGARRRNRTR